MSSMPPKNPETGELIVPMRLQKYLARAGVASRRGSEDLMTAGRVKLNGIVVRELGTKLNPLTDKVTVDGLEVNWGDKSVYLMLNKPAGYLTTMKDPQGRKTVAELLPLAQYPGLFPVGRLDRDTTGMLLCMTDGELAAKLLHPSRHVEKLYQVSVEGRLQDSELSVLREGIVLDDGPCAPAQVRIISGSELEHKVQAQLKRPLRSKTGQQEIDHAEIILKEGRKRQVKRMFSAINHPVLALHRKHFGGLSLNGLEEGAYRLLTQDEINQLKDQVS